MDKHAKKLALNENNKYNHNFSGRYCICDRRFPPDEADDSAEANDEMWQCIVCEDWYHTKHLGAKELPQNFDELICGPCVNRLDFVHYYKYIDQLDQVMNTVDSQNGAEKPCAEDNTATGPDTETPTQNTNPDHVSQDESVTAKTEGSESPNPVCESDTNDSQSENKDPGHGPVIPSTQTKSDCILEKLIGAYELSQSQGSRSSHDSKTEISKQPLFWSDCSWRAKLCRCEKCMIMYKTKECEYLLDDKDTVQYYEAQGKELAKNNESRYERGMSALNRMNRAAVVEALHGYDELKANLSDYLRKFADTKKVVREEDIHDFFQQLKSKKRPRLEYE